MATHGNGHFEHLRLPGAGILWTWSTTEPYFRLLSIDETPPRGYTLTMYQPGVGRALTHWLQHRRGQLPPPGGRGQRGQDRGGQDQRRASLRSWKGIGLITAAGRAGTRR